MGPGECWCVVSWGEEMGLTKSAGLIDWLDGRDCWLSWGSSSKDESYSGAVVLLGLAGFW